MVIIDNINSGTGGAEGRVRAGNRDYELYFRSERDLSDGAADSFLLLALPAAMRCNEALAIDIPVSSQLLRQIDHVQDIYRCWDSKLHKVEVRATSRIPAKKPPGSLQQKVAVAFTGGVDSFYSAIESPDACLLFVHGLDIPLGNRDLRNRVSERLAWAAAKLNRPFLEMETNVRRFSDDFLDWHLAFGGVLAACAQLMSGKFGIFGIPAGQSYELLHPDGAHPVLNPLFSTESVLIQTLGCEVRRIDKVKAIATHPAVRGALRVCWENRGDAYNCGVCEKCLRTMASMEIFGSLSSCSTFDRPLDYERLSRAVAADPALDMFIRENLETAREFDASPELIDSLEKSLDPRRSRLLRSLRSMTPRKFNDWRYRLFQRPRKMD